MIAALGELHKGVEMGLISKDEALIMRAEIMAEAMKKAKEAGVGGTAAASGGGGSHEDYFLHKEARELEEWRRDEQKIARYMAATQRGYDEGQAEAWETLCGEYVEKASASLLSANQMLVANYLLFANEYGRYLFAKTLVLRGEKEALRVHNWTVAKGVGEPFVDAEGEAISSLNLPLFPHKKELKALNFRLLQGVKTKGKGEGEVTGGARPIFFKGDGERLDVAVPEVFGGGYVPIYVVDGAVDVGSIQDAFNTLANRVNTLEKRGERGGRGGGRGGGGRGYGAPPPQQQRRCYSCGGIGHIANHCPQGPAATAGPQQHYQGGQGYQQQYHQQQYPQHQNHQQQYPQHQNHQQQNYQQQGNNKQGN